MLIKKTKKTTESTESIELICQTRILFHKSETNKKKVQKKKPLIEKKRSIILMNSVL